MSANPYEKKRNFDKTPEPRSIKKSSQNELIFVVQMHDARHLHYDLRLELNGVLKSWAVPKGPSLDPTQKRLAIMVEDHPFDYKDFEGVIPTGNYGAGPVIVWDRGTYRTLQDFKTKKEMETELQKKLQKGHISFFLEGNKLKGEFSLVEINHVENTWLLIKKNDNHASTEDVTKTARSVISGRAINEIDLGFDFGDAQKEEMPELIKPMIAETTPKIFDDPDWLFEIKWDGYRAIAKKKSDAVELISRNGIKFMKYRLIEFELKNIDHDVILDGEIVVVDEVGRADFHSLQNYEQTAVGNLVFYVFDILHLDGYNLRNLPLLKRKEILEAILPKSEVIRISGHILESGVSFYDAVKKKEIEGVVAKKIDSLYLPGKTTSSWLKYKMLNRVEAVITGYTAPRSRKYFGSLVLGMYELGEIRYVGHVGSGFDDLSLKLVYEKMQALIVKESPFKKEPRTNEVVTWVRPVLICEVKFQEWTEEGLMRIPIYLGLREDKEAGDVVMESPKNNGESKIYLEKQKDKKMVLDGQELKLTHLEKIYWPEEGYSKGDLIDYYLKISKYILPHLAGRPENLFRQPDGISDKGFWHKNLETLPDWADYKKVFSESANKIVNHLVCKDTASLIFMINLGCIEVNPWFSRIHSLDYPDFFVLDLDPEDIEFDKVVETAQTIKTILDEAGLTGFCKTSGSRGLHILIPLGAKYSYETAVTLAKIIATLAHKRLPDFTSLERDPAVRQKKVYIDFLQNGSGKTIAAPYCVRPKRGAPVSAPLKWKEVKPGLNPKDFNIISMPKRLEKIGDILAPLLKEETSMKEAVENLSKLI